MSFLLFILIGTALAWIPQRLIGQGADRRMAMRQGMALALTFTGVDHFVSAHSRYVPMIPDPLAEWALPLVQFTGAAELAGALGLAVPASLYARLGWPNLQRLAGSALAVMFCCLVAANINVAIKGTGVDGLNFLGPIYFWIRPALQPLFVGWVLYAVGAWPREAGTTRAGSVRRGGTTRA